MTAPPVGYRPAIPVKTKFDAVMRQEGKCAKCGEKLGEWTDTQFDHRPPLQIRVWDEGAGDTVPSANSPEHIEAIHKDCHKVRTTGRRGDSKLSKRGGDVSDIAKVKRLSKKEEEFRRRLLTKGVEETDSDGLLAKPQKKAWPKRPWAKRPFAKRKKDTPQT